MSAHSHSSSCVLGTYNEYKASWGCNNEYKRQRRHSLSLGRLVGGRGEGGASWTTRGTKRNETRREAAVWSGLVVPTPQSGAGSRKLLSYAPYCLCILLLTFFCAGDGERAEQGEGRKEGGVERTGETFSVRPTQQHPFLSHFHPHQLKPFTHALSGHPLDLNAPFAPSLSSQPRQTASTHVHHHDITAVSRTSTVAVCCYLIVLSNYLLLTIKRKL